MKNCEICGNAFEPRKNTKVGRGRFCSTRCRNTNNSRVSSEHRGNLMRRTGTKGYVKFNGVHEHRVIAEKMLERPLVYGEIVHHKDGNKKNNTPENLVVMTQGEHMREHGIGIPGIPLAHEPWRYRRKGQDLPFSILTDTIILDIRARVAAGEKQKDIGAMYGIKQSYVSQIATRKLWRHV